MPRNLSGLQTSTPVVSLVGSSKNPAPAGRFLVGILGDGPRIAKMQKGSMKVFEFGFLRSNAPTQKKVNGEYVNTEVKEQETVTVFAPTALARDLERAEKGDVVVTIYLGKKMTKDGVPFHAFQTVAYTMDEYIAMTEEDLNAATQIRTNA